MQSLVNQTLCESIFSLSDSCFSLVAINRYYTLAANQISLSSEEITVGRRSFDPLLIMKTTISGYLKKKNAFPAPFPLAARESIPSSKRKKRMRCVASMECCERVASKCCRQALARCVRAPIRTRTRIYGESGMQFAIPTHPRLASRRVASFVIHYEYR